MHVSDQNHVISHVGPWKNAGQIDFISKKCTFVVQTNKKEYGWDFGVK